MNDGRLDNYFDDLKQYLAAALSRSEARLEANLIVQLEQFEAVFDARINRLELKMEDGFAGIADILETQNNRLDKHEQRLTALEQTAS